MDDWVTSLAAFFIIWWMVLFFVLPWGVRNVGVADIEEGHSAGAPQKAHMGRKVLITTVIAVIAWGVFDYLAAVDFISFRDG